MARMPSSVGGAAATLPPTRSMAAITSASTASLMRMLARARLVLGGKAGLDVAAGETGGDALAGRRLDMVEARAAGAGGCRGPCR